MKDTTKITIPQEKKLYTEEEVGSLAIKQSKKFAPKNQETGYILGFIDGIKTNKGAFDENGDAITRGYVEPKEDDVEKLAKNEARRIYGKNEIGNKIVYFYAGACFANKHLKQTKPKQEESSNWDEIFEAWLHTKSHIDLSLEEVNCLKNWLKDHYNPPVKR